jgi:hypothetical protein
MVNRKELIVNADLIRRCLVLLKFKLGTKKRAT